MNNKNKGMLLEKLINKTIKHYDENDIALIHKKQLDIKFSGINANTLKLENGRIYKKSTADYYGVMDGRFIAFEAKSTIKDDFVFRNIMEHQHKYLSKVEKHNGIGFYIISFHKFNRVFLVQNKDILTLGKNKISINDFEKIGTELEIQYPGIIDFIWAIKNC